MQAAEPSLECDSNYSCSKKNSSSCFKEHESNESTECRLNIKQEMQARNASCRAHRAHFAVRFGLFVF